MVLMASPFRFRPNLDGFENRLVPSGTSDSPPGVTSSPTAGEVAIANEGVINLSPMGNKDGTLIAVTKIRVRAEAADGTVYDVTFGVSSPATVAGQTERIAENMRRDGWDVAIVDGHLIIYGHNNPDGTLSRVTGVGARSPDPIKPENQPAVDTAGEVKELDLTKIQPPVQED
jgi:hypothetical protein